jgi:phospholipid-binding lipoprotein MlaA
MIVMAAMLALSGQPVGESLPALPDAPLVAVQPDQGIQAAEQRPDPELSETDNAVPPEPQDAVPAEPATPASVPNEIVVEGSLEAPPGDPLAKLNAQTFEVVQQVDEAVVEPLASGYQKALPKPVRSGLFNFFSNLREPVVFLNFLLQGKPGKAVETLGRFAINSTAGIAGLVDVAKKEPFNLPRRRNGFANTLAIYGVKDGAFLVVPLVGPTTVRDLVGTLVDNAVVPTLAGKPFTEPYVALPAFTVVSLESRIELDEKLTMIRDSDEPYTTMRETYLRERQAEINALRGRPVAAPEQSKVVAPEEAKPD